MPTNLKSNYTVITLYGRHNNIIEAFKLSANRELRHKPINHQVLNDQKCKIQIPNQNFTYFNTDKHYSQTTAPTYIEVFDITIAYWRYITLCNEWISVKKYDNRSS